MPRQLEFSRLIYEQDKKDKIAGVAMPEALERKYAKATKDWAWFWLFPSGRLTVAPRLNTVRRHHLYKDTVQKQCKDHFQKGTI